MSDVNAGREGSGMSDVKTRNMIRRVVDMAMTVLLLCLMAYQVTGEAAHEWIGMAMSAHAVPFLYGMAPVSFARQTHLSMSHWSFVLMGLHLGLHVPAMAAGMKMKDGTKRVLARGFTAVGCIGLWLFLRSGIPDYLFFRVPFAFLDYEKAGWLVFLENLAMLLGFAAVGAWLSVFLRRAGRSERKAV